MAAPTEMQKELADYLSGQLETELVEIGFILDELVLRTHSQHILRVLTFLRDDSQCQFRCLVDLCGTDYPHREQRFDVVYNLLSMQRNQRIRSRSRPMKQRLSLRRPTCFRPPLVRARDLDMFGVFFSDHPDLRRLLTITV